MAHLRTPERSELFDAHPTAAVPNYLRVFALRPEIYAGWLHLGAAVRGGMDERRYELVTLAVARRLGSPYCALAHAAVLRDRFYDDATLRAIAVDHHHAGLGPVDVAVMDFAELIAVAPGDAGETDFATLRGHGLSEVDIFQVVAAVALRRFFTGVLDAVGAVPDPVYDALDPSLRAALTVAP